MCNYQITATNSLLFKILLLCKKSASSLVHKLGNSVSARIILSRVVPRVPWGFPRSRDCVFVFQNQLWILPFCNWSKAQLMKRKINFMKYLPYLPNQPKCTLHVVGLLTFLWNCFKNSSRWRNFLFKAVIFEATSSGKT